jgi:hypothetical protein
MLTFLRLLAVFVTFTMPQAVRAAPVEQFYTGHKLFSYCTGTEELQLVCSGYVSGVLDTLAIYRNLLKRGIVCLPGSVTMGEAKDVVVNWLRAHPEERQFTAAGSVTAALQETFPCKQ